MSLINTTTKAHHHEAPIHRSIGTAACGLAGANGHSGPSGLYACAGTPTVCNDFTPLVIESRSTSTDPEGEEIAELSFAVVPDSSFRVSSVHPNPFQEELTIRLTASYAGEAQIKMVNLLGQPVLLEERAFIRGYTPIVLDTRSARLLPGLYVLIVTDGRGGRFTEKVIYQR